MKKFVFAAIAAMVMVSVSNVFASSKMMIDNSVDIGFKEIEVGFPSASDTEYEILRTLIEGNYIPDDVTVQVLVQARAELIKKTFEPLKALKTLLYIFIIQLQLCSAK